MCEVLFHTLFLPDYGEAKRKVIIILADLLLILLLLIK